MIKQYYAITNKYSWRAFIRERPEEYRAFRQQYKDSKAQMAKEQSDLEKRIILGYN